MRITTRRSVGRLTSSKPAAAKMLRLPTWSSTAGDVLPGLGDHRVALEGAGAALPGEVDGGAGERPADPAAAEAGAGDEAGDGPDAVVGLVLRPARPTARGSAAAGAGRRCAARPRTSRRARRRGRRRGRSSCPTPGARSRSARAAGRRAPRRRTRPRPPAAASCSAGTGSGTGRRACRRPPARSSQLASFGGDDHDPVRRSASAVAPSASVSPRSAPAAAFARPGAGDCGAAPRK